MKSPILALCMLTGCVLPSLHAADAVSLGAAVTRAQSEHPDMAIARERVIEAQAQLAQTAAAWQPMVGIDAGYTYMDYPLYTFGAILNQEAFTPTIDFNDTPHADDLHLSLNAGYRIYDGGRRGAHRQAARSGLQAAEAGEEAVRQELGFQAAQAWLQSYQAAQHGDAAEAMRDALRSHLSTARSHQQQGTLVEAEVLEVDVRLQEAEEQLLRIRNQQHLAAAALGNILGSQEAIDIDGALPEWQPPEDSGERAELRAARAMTGVADQAVDAERAAHLPSIDAFGSLDYHDGFELDEGDGRVGWMAGVKLHVSIWDGHLTSNRVLAAESRRLAARSAERRAALQIQLQQTEARLALANARERLIVAEQGLALANKHVELTAARFDEGLATVTQMVDAESQRTAARIRLTNTKADVLMATISLRHALGLPIVPNN